VNPTHALATLAATTPAGPTESALFWILAAGCFLTAVGIVLSREIIRTAVCLFGTLASAAAMYFLLGAYFLGAIQLIVYAGGTLVLIVFGVMLTARTPWTRFGPSPLELLAATGICAALLLGLVTILLSTAWPGQATELPDARTARIGQELLGNYLVPFEVASILLLVVMIGAAFLARPIRRLGRRGRETQP
jgi:NADH-quinone oxidoreductase subunit J